MSNKHRRHKNVPLLQRAGGGVSIQSDNELSESMQIEIDTAISNHIRKKINNWLKWWGFRNSPTIIIVIVAGVLISNLAVNALTVGNSEYCLYLNICVLLFQAESVVLYGFAVYSVSKKFIDKVVSQLTHIDICSREYRQIVDQYTTKKHGIVNDNDNESEVILSSLKIINPNIEHQNTSLKVYEAYKPIARQSGTNILKNEVLKCLLIIIPSYLSGYLIFFASDNSSEGWHLYVYISNILDVIRYAPQILHIALARSYFQTFPIELQRLRDSFGVIRRKDELNDDDYECGKHKLTVTHQAFIEGVEKVIRPYRILSSQLSEWIVVYLICNAGSFTFFLLSIVSALLNKDCQYNELGLYYVHYLIELVVFFVGWVFLVWPYCANESILDKFFNDVKTMANINATQKCAIDRYIDSYSEKSPFSIYSIKPSYGKFMNLLYIVFATITLDIVSKVYDVDLI